MTTEPNIDSRVMALEIKVELLERQLAELQAALTEIAKER